MSSLVSILVPVYNGARYLAPALTSCLEQSHRELEVVVVDDASTDGSLALAREFERRDARVRVLARGENGGISRALNDGLRAARGDYLTRLAQDDGFRPDAIAYLVAALERMPEAGLVYGNMMIIDGAGQPIHPLIMAPPERVLFPANRLGLYAMWRRAVWEKVGDFCSACDTAEDYDYWLRVSRHFSLRKAGEEIPFYFRYHPEQGSVRSEHRQRIATRRALLRYWWAEWKDRPLNPYPFIKMTRAAVSLVREKG